jgi:hypothetical protein
VSLTRPPYEAALIYVSRYAPREHKRPPELDIHHARATCVGAFDASHLGSPIVWYAYVVQRT